MRARCLLAAGCDWTAEGEVDDVELEARRHSDEGGKLKGAQRPGHPTLVQLARIHPRTP